jgi:hypothetical protein
MTALGTPTWQSQNQALLVAALDGVKTLLRRHADRGQSATAKNNGTPGEETVSTPDRPVLRHDLRIEPLPALDTLCAGFGLSPFERDVLLLCAGIELDSTFATLSAAAQGEPSRNYPTFSLALAALPGAHWSALAPDAPLRRWRLLEVGAGPALTVAPLRIDERVLHYLVGVHYLDERLAGMVELLAPGEADDLAPSQSALIERIVAAWSVTERRRTVPVVQLCGPDPSERRAVAIAAAVAVGRRIAVLSADLVPTIAAELEALLRLCERESALSGLILLVEGDDHGADQSNPRGARRLLERIGGPVILSDRERRRIVHRPVVSFDVERPTADEQRSVWRSSLGTRADSDSAGVDAIAAQFSLGLPAIRSVAAETVARCVNSPEQPIGRSAWDVCRHHSRTRLEDLAQRIEPAATWDELVLPDVQAESVRRIARHVRHRATVHDHWGFAARSARNLGITALFAGVSGTGKTMAAEVLANELRLDLYRIDLASVVSKYIGETEKNLRRVFDAAEDGGAILLFDEADALFGKRSEVKDSHDRYANIEVSYLLQRMEAYRGLAILTTNLKSSLDSAFLRRLRFVIQFPFPEPPQRAEIWRRIFPASTPTEGLDYSKLAKLNIPGGQIRNIALSAAFLAAHAGEPVRMSHLREAAKSEYSKLERPLTDAEIGGWI